MKDFIIYLLQVSVCLGIFSSIYFLFLRKQTFFRFNRIFLLTGLIGAFILPFIQFTYDVVVMPISIPITEELPDMIPTTNSTTLSIWYFLLAIYTIGVVFLIARNIKSYAKLYKIKKEGKCKKVEGYNVVESPETGIAFSVLNYIFINPEKLQAKEKEVILKHEISHIKQKHWIDLLCGECALLLQWFNPLIWFYIHWIKENHEYLADQAVIEAGESSAVYRAVLINQQFQDPIFSFANSFSYPNHLNRLNMIKKTKTQSWKKISILAILPLFGVFFSLSAKPNYVEAEMQQDKKNTTSLSNTAKNKPLVFADGKEVENISDIDPNTIERMNVLKDKAATDLYGEKGKNGVILLELKEGTKIQNKGAKDTKPTAIGDKTIRGTVINSEGKPLTGVAIKVKGATSGTVTDKDGNYSIKLNDGDILSFSYVDYKAKEVKTNKESSIVNVTLEQ